LVNPGFGNGHGASRSETSMYRWPSSALLELPAASAVHVALELGHTAFGRGCILCSSRSTSCKLKDIGLKLGNRSVVSLLRRATRCVTVLPLSFVNQVLNDDVEPLPSVVR